MWHFSLSHCVIKSSIYKVLPESITCMATHSTKFYSVLLEYWRVLQLWLCGKHTIYMHIFEITSDSLIHFLYLLYAQMSQYTDVYQLQVWLGFLSFIREEELCCITDTEQPSCVWTELPADSRAQSGSGNCKSWADGLFPKGRQKQTRKPQQLMLTKKSCTFPFNYPVVPEEIWGINLIIIIFCLPVPHSTNLSLKHLCFDNGGICMQAVCLQLTNLSAPAVHS